MPHARHLTAKAVLESPQYTLSGGGGRDLYDTTVKFSQGWARGNRYSTGYPKLVATLVPRPGSGQSEVRVSTHLTDPKEPPVYSREYLWPTEAELAPIKAELTAKLTTKIAARGLSYAQIARPTTLIVPGNLRQVLPAVDDLKYAWARNPDGGPNHGLGTSAELVAGLAATKEPGETMYRLVASDHCETSIDPGSSIFVLATAAQLSQLKARLDKTRREKFKAKVVREARQLVTPDAGLTTGPAGWIGAVVRANYYVLRPEDQPDGVFCGPPG